MKSAHTPKLTDPTAEKARAAHADAIAELQQQPFVRGRVIEGVRLEDGKATTIAHGLGHAPVWVAPSAPRPPDPASGGGASVGVIKDLSRDGKTDRAKSIKLVATGFGYTVTVDVAVA